MNGRQRIDSVLRFQRPDRVPVDLNIHYHAYDRLRSHLGMSPSSAAPSGAMEVVPDVDLLERLGIDVISVRLGGRRQSNGPLPDKRRDAWGIERALSSAGGSAQYYEAVSHPLAGASVEDLDRYPWPETRPIAAAETLARDAEQLHRETGLALMGRFGGPVLELAADLIGTEEWYIRLMEDRPFIKALLKKISHICTEHDLLGIEHAGPWLSIMKVSGEDFGMQTNPLYSRDIFEQVLLPPLAERWQRVRSALRNTNERAGLMLHSCGSMDAFIPELIRAGIEILDPVQPCTEGMSPPSLRRRFGGQLVFHGGVDVQKLLPSGTPEEVAEAVESILEGFDAGHGGFILAPSHAVQGDVPPENLLAMFEAAQAWSVEAARPVTGEQLDNRLTRLGVRAAAEELSIGFDEVFSDSLADPAAYADHRWVVMSHSRATGPVIHAVPPMDKAEEIPWEEWYRLDGQLHHTVLFLGQRAETTGEFVGDAEDLDHPRAVLGRRWFLQNALTPRPYLSEGRSRI